MLILSTVIIGLTFGTTHEIEINCNIQNGTASCFNLEFIPTPTNSDEIEKLVVQESETLNIMPNSLTGFKNLKILDLSNNRLSYLPETSVKDNLQLRVLVLNHNGFSEIPKLISNSLVELSIGYCYLENLNTEFIEGLPKLRILQLLGNKFLQPEDILKIANLPSLHLINLNGQSVECKANSVDIDLKETDFMGMCLGYCPTNCVCEENSIKCSDLNDISGYLEVVQKHTLLINKNTKEIKWPKPDPSVIYQVIIENGTLSALKEDEFVNFNSVNYISLSNNKLDSLPKYLVSNHTKLNYLKLSNNKFKEIPNFVSTSLIFLDLDHNEITTITRDILFNLPNLQDLNLKFNNIRFVGNAFDNYRGRLININLKFNPLQTIGRNYHLERQLRGDVSVYQLDNEVYTNYSVGLQRLNYSEPLLLMLLLIQCKII